MLLGPRTKGQYFAAKQNIDQKIVKKNFKDNGNLLTIVRKMLHIYSKVTVLNAIDYLLKIFEIHHKDLM